ncbi:D-alanine--poly(phosphoribitol) ligase subunit DltA [Oscillospiraceae bacterium HV4-5-C5C]|nr:D-alanine--poly(phosphoribitol) ligase subunit DltA [Oscillospiraceae bacterium HV4-5-C5C]
MRILEELERIASHRLEGNSPVALCYDDEELSWLELSSYSDRLAVFLDRTYPGDRQAIVVYGHKSPWMVVAFLACMKSGHAYCPVDSYYPTQRVLRIVETVANPCVLMIEPLALDESYKPLSLTEIKKLVNFSSDRAPFNAASLTKSGESAHCSTVDRLCPLRDDETCYMIFTSGSTGDPKGVQISGSNLWSFTKWISDLVRSSPHSPFTNDYQTQIRCLNQAPFSFDLSAMDLYLALISGGTVCSIPRHVIDDPKQLFNALFSLNLDVWVSTPSFVDLCLTERDFDETHLPGLKIFLFCGETLTNRSYDKLQQRFPHADIYNTYGPTETTVAVTEVLVTPEISATEQPLPVGKAKPGTRICIMDGGGGLTATPVAEGGAVAASVAVAAASCEGEIIIAGDSVSLAGYFKKPEQTARAFFELNLDGQTYHAYHTGDLGYLKGEQLYYQGRMDSQIKLHGYRIELGDIERNLLQLPGVEHAAVLPSYRRGQIHSLTAYVQCVQFAPDKVTPDLTSLNDPALDEAKLAQLLREDLAQLLPDYMLPRKVVFVSDWPMTENGKLDRKRLEGLV